MTRKLLASFLEYAATGKVTNEEARRFAQGIDQDDPMMVDAVREYIELIPYPYYLNGNGIAHPNADRIYEIARNLREAPSED